MWRLKHLSSWNFKWIDLSTQIRFISLMPFQYENWEIYPSYSVWNKSRNYWLTQHAVRTGSSHMGYSRRLIKCFNSAHFHRRFGIVERWVNWSHFSMRRRLCWDLQLWWWKRTYFKISNQLLRVNHWAWYWKDHKLRI